MISMTAMRHSHPRSGTTIVEFVVACSVLGSLMMLVVPSAVRIGRAQQALRQERIAVDEVTNQMERLTELPLDQLKEEMDELTASETAISRLPNPELQGTLEENADGYRLVVEISWNSPGRRRAPLSMATWVYPSAAGDAPREDPAP